MTCRITIDRYGSKFFLVSMPAVTSDIIADLIIAVFVLWILKPELFDKKEVKGL